MKIITEFTFGFREDRTKKIENDIAKELYAWRRKIKKYKTGKKMISEDLYKMDQSEILYDSIVKFANAFPKEIEINEWGETVKCDEKEIKNAVAFVPNFHKHYCREYDDVYRNYKMCRFCYAYLEEEFDNVYIRPYGFVKRKENAYGLLTLDANLRSWMVTPQLYEKIIQSGISEEYFRPVYSKRRAIYAYELISKNILPEYPYIDPNYIYKRTCSQCGTITYVRDNTQYKYIQKQMTKDGVKSLEPVNLTTEFYNEQPQIIINKELYDIIWKYIPDAIDWSFLLHS